MFRYLMLHQSMLHYFYVALVAVSLLLHAALVVVAQFNFEIAYEIAYFTMKCCTILMLRYINVALVHIELLMLHYLNVALFTAALFNVSLY